MGICIININGNYQRNAITGPFMIALVVAIIVSYSIASAAAPEGADPVLYGIFGTAMTAMAMLSLGRNCS